MGAALLLSILTVAPPLGPPALAAPPPATKTDVADRAEAAFQFVLGKMLAEESDFESAMEAFKRSVELDGSDPYAHLELAKFQLYLSQISRSAETRRRHLREAADLMTAARSVAPENLDVLKEYGQVFLRLGEHELQALEIAQEAFEELHAKTEGDLQVLTSLGQIYLWKQQPREAAEVFREAAGLLPGQRAILVPLVEALLGSEQYEEAEAALTRLIELAPDSLEHRLQLASVLSQRGAHRDASDMLAASPPDLLENAQLRHSLARELHLAGRNDAALGLVDGLIEELPDSPGLIRLRVAVLTAMARYGEAIADLEPLVAADENPRRQQDSMLLSRLLERVGQGEEAAERLRDLLRRDPETEQLQVKIALAGVLEREGLADQAADLLAAELATAQQDQVSALATMLARLLVRAQRHEEASAVLDGASERLAAAGENGAADGLRLGQLAMLAEKEDWSRLLDAATSLAAGAGDRLGTEVTLLRSEALSQLGRVEEALELLPAEPSSADGPQYLAQRCKVLFDHGRDDEARQKLEELAATGAPEDLFFAARVYQQSEKYDDVVPLMERLVALRPDSLQALFLLGAAQERLGRAQDGADSFRRVLALDPDHTPTLNYLGYMWAERGENLADALSMISRAVALDPDNGAYVDSLGWAYYRLGRYDEARGHLEWAARLIPTDPTIFEHLGDLYVVLDDVERARVSYRQAIELDGDNVDEIRRKLEALPDQGL